MTAWSVLVQVASAVVVIAALVVMVRWARTPALRPETPLERAQAPVLIAGVLALGLSTFVPSPVLDAVWVVAVFVVLALALVRRRRGEPALPAW